MIKAKIVTFFSAVERNDFGGVLSALSSHPELIDEPHCNYPPWYAVHAAAHHGSVDVLRLLGRRGANLHQRDHLLRTPLHYAAKNNHVGVIKYLVKKGAPLECFDCGGATPLKAAARETNFEALEILIKAGANTNAADLQLFTPLMNASRAEDVEVVILLLVKGAEVSAVNIAGITALHFAAENCDDSTQALIKAGADVNAADFFGVTPLHSAVLSRIQPHHDRVVRLLTRAGAKVEASDNLGNTPLHYAVAMGKGASALLSEGAFVDSRNKELQTPLDYLMSKRELGYTIHLTTLLLSNGASPNARDNIGMTPFHHAALSPQLYKFLAVEELIKAGAEVTAMDIQGRIAPELMPPGDECEDFQLLLDRLIPDWKQKMKRSARDGRQQLTLNFP